MNYMLYELLQIFLSLFPWSNLSLCPMVSSLEAFLEPSLCLWPSTHDGADIQPGLDFKPGP
jgi:hypothetical protein